jgi:hypothetical protein
MTDSPTPTLTVRKLIVERMRDDSGLLAVMHPDGKVEFHTTPTRLVRAVKRQDKRAAARGESTATVIEWRYMPRGFRPPR